MATTMLNVRMDTALKSDGERVLRRNGVTATDAVRGLYQHIGQTDEVPDFCKPQSGAISAEQRREKMRKLAGIAKLSPGEGLEDLKAERLSRMGV